MADVNILVAVETAGVPAALANIEALKNRGATTATSLQTLGTTATKAMRDIAAAAAAPASGMLRLRDNANSAVSGVTRLTESLDKLKSGYQTISVASLGGTAASRLSLLGGGDLEKGKALALKAQNIEEALTANLIQDRLTVERQELALIDARGNKITAQAELTRATENSQLIGVTAAQKAQVQLTRAKEEYIAAQKASAELANRPQPRTSTGRFASAANSPEFINQETEAIRREAVALDQLNAAQERVLGHQNSIHSNAFQSSFSYFIIAGMAQQAAQAIQSIGAASITASSQIERSFADVNRTFDGTQAQLSSLQSKLFALSTTTPISFTDLAQIAALGNQLGIAAQDIQSFTTTISQYSAISGQSAEDAATAFGRIANLTALPAAQFSNLASSIEYVARTSVATESTITNTAKEITALASGAGFSAQSIVGLSGALSSLAIPPERARGALSLYFGALNTAVASGGPKLEAFAVLTGKTTDEINNLVRSNKGEEVFTSFIAGLSKLDTVAKTSALKELGLSTIRVDQTMRALAQNVPLLTSSLAGANNAFQANTELSRQYGIIQATLSSKIIEFQNAIQNAAGAVGDSLAPALIGLLELVTSLIVGFTDFAKTPIGGGLLAFAGIVGTIAFVLLSLTGAAALAKASLVVIPWALSGLGAKFAENSVFQFILSLIGLSGAVKPAASGQAALALSLEGTAVAANTASAAVRVTRTVIGTLSIIGAAVAIIGTLAEAFGAASSASKLTADNVSGLAEAIAADTATYRNTGAAITTFSGQADKTTVAQQDAAKASKNWAQVLGNDLVGGANAASGAIAKIAAGDKVTEAFRTAIGSNEALKPIISDSNFAKTWTDYGLNMTQLIAAGIRSDGKAGNVQDAIDRMLGGVTKTQITSGTSGLSTTLISDKNGKDITDFYNQLQTLAGALAAESTTLQDSANSTTVLGSSAADAAAGVTTLGNGFLGVTSGLKAFQDSVQSGLSSFSSFSTILSTLNTAAGKSKSPISATAFGAELTASNARAVDFFKGIQSLANSGRTEFATSLAALGPEAQGILSSSLKLSSASKNKLEAGARFAAFIASDAFKLALTKEMSTTNDAYALIFGQTHNLSDVQSYINAQVAGTGAAWEKAWDIKHPTLPLNVVIQNPTPADFAGLNLNLPKTIAITAQVKPTFDPKSLTTDVGSTTYTDLKTKASITLPANLSGAALSASLAYWLNNENATPQEIVAMLNTDNFSNDLDAWRAAHGPIDVYAKIVPLGVTSLSNKLVLDAPTKANGGEIPGFSAGGGWGQFRGPGTGTSDSILARVSAGEFISTASATSYWGPDFFDSLNRKMLPTSFLNLLGSAVSGNQGPSHVAHVQVVQNNPVTRDPLKQLRENSEMVAAGIWG